MIEIITELQAIAQTGLTYGNDKFDKERYKRILEISAQLLSTWSTHECEDILGLFEKEAGFATPKVEVRAAIFKEDKILLVQECEDHLWTLPGGWADVNLSAAENVVKEIREEAGFECSVVKLIALYDKRQNTVYKRWPHIYKIFFLCKLENLQQFEFDKNEILNVGFFSQEDIPELSPTRVTKKQLDTCFKHFYDPKLETEFD